MNLEEAKKVLIENGYVFVKVTDAMSIRMDRCVNGEDEDCCDCICNVCILQNL